MARFARLDVLNEILDLGVVTIFYQDDLEVAKQVAEACLAGGARVLEFTNRGDHAPIVFKELSQYLAENAPRPSWAWVRSWMRRLPPCTSHMEPTLWLDRSQPRDCPAVQSAQDRLLSRLHEPHRDCAGGRAGCGNRQFFPAGCGGGPEFVEMVLGPCPWTRIMPTGGVDATQESIEAWFRAGVACVGIGSNIIRKEWVAAGDWAAITGKVRQVLAWITEARS